MIAAFFGFAVLLPCEMRVALIFLSESHHTFLHPLSLSSFVLVSPSSEGQSALHSTSHPVGRFHAASHFGPLASFYSTPKSSFLVRCFIDSESTEFRNKKCKLWLEAGSPAPHQLQVRKRRSTASLRTSTYSPNELRAVRGQTLPHLAAKRPCKRPEPLHPCSPEDARPAHRRLQFPESPAGTSEAPFA